MASPASINNENYDPKVDKARKANSNDPGWKYAYWANLQKPDKVTCTICDTEVSGGIKRLKQHLAGGYGDAKMCPKTTTAIRKERRNYLESNKRRRPLFNEEGDEPPEEPANVVVVNAVAAPTARAEFVQVEDTAPAESQASKATAASNTKAKPNVNKSIVEMLRKTPKELVDERRKGCSQPTIPAKIRTKGEKHYVDQRWALWFYECGVPFNAAAARQFDIAVEATAQIGSGYKPPTPYMLGEPLLKDVVKLTRTYFLESVGASSEVHDAFMLADLLEAKIEEIGKDKVVRVITDNGANYKAAGRILMERISTLYWSPCAAHYFDLMLEEIENLKEFKKTITRAKHVTTFIYKHGRIFRLMREKTGADHIALELQPLVVDGDERPAMLEVAALINRGKEKIKLTLLLKTRKPCSRISLRSLRSVGKTDDATVGQLRGYFLDVLGRMVEDEEIRSKIDAQSLDYDGLRGDAFSNKIAKQNLQNLNPLDWWRSYGGRAIELQRFARRIMDTDKRNRLLHKRLNDIVFVSYNRKMKTRNFFDPLVIEEFDWDNEWTDSSYVHPQGARGCDNGDNSNGLTWEHVDEVVGASSSLRGRNLPRNASSKRARNGQTRLAKLEEDFVGPMKKRKRKIHMTMLILLFGRRKESSDHQKGLRGRRKLETGESLLHGLQN
ncbi:uncharacterized protein [Miscanthus floridulus]|uniref:uncharacterized protein n=1 Tax=Miscanthus floridulus TaxID=154761 RepID=UPI00345A52B6